MKKQKNYLQKLPLTSDLNAEFNDRVLTTFKKK